MLMPVGSFLVMIFISPSILRYPRALHTLFVLFARKSTTGGDWRPIQLRLVVPEDHVSKGAKCSYLTLSLLLRLVFVP